MSSYAARNYSSELLRDRLFEPDAPIIWDAAFSSEPFVWAFSSLPCALAWVPWAALDPVEPSVAPGLAADQDQSVVREVVQVRSAVQAQVQSAEPAAGRVLSVGRGRSAGQARMEVSYRFSEHPL